MTTPSFTQNPTHFQRKGVRILLRGNRSLEGIIHIPEGQALLPFLGIRKHFLNLTSVRWDDGPSDAEPLQHLSIRLSSIVWVVPLEASLHVTSATEPTEAGRDVELELVDDRILHVTLNIAGEQRMSDYFDSNLPFIPLWNVRVLSTSGVLERLAVNHKAILSIREI